MSKPAEQSSRWGLRIATDTAAGAGHLMRCRAILNYLPDTPALFIDPGTGIAGRDATTEPTRDSLATMIEQAEAGALHAALIDSYVIDRAQIDQLADLVFTVAIADDGRRHNAAQIVIPGLTPQIDRALCAGPQFAPLAPAYAIAHAQALGDAPQAHQPPRLLVAFGAGDSANCTGKALDAIAQLPMPVDVTVMLGATAPHLPDLAERIARLPNIQLRTAPGDVIPLYQHHDLAIGAPGISFLERLCCGLPSLLLCQNETQRPIARAVTAQGLATTPPSDDAAAIAAELTHLLANPDHCAALRRSGLRQIDGRGAERLATTLENARRRHHG